MGQETTEIIRILEANRGGAVTVHYKDGEVTTSQILFVDDHLYLAFCHKVIRTNRPEKHDGEYRADSSWMVGFDRVERVEVAQDGPKPWGAPLDRPAGQPSEPRSDGSTA